MNSRSSKFTESKPSKFVDINFLDKYIFVFHLGDGGKEKYHMPGHMLLYAIRKNPQARTCIMKSIQEARDE